MTEYPADSDETIVLPPASGGAHRSGPDRPAQPRGEEPVWTASFSADTTGPIPVVRDEPAPADPHAGAPMAESPGGAYGPDVAAPAYGSGLAAPVYGSEVAAPAYGSDLAAPAADVSVAAYPSDVSVAAYPSDVSVAAYPSDGAVPASPDAVTAVWSPLPEPVVATAAGYGARAVAVETLPAAASEEVTCPECGTVARVTLSRREAADFCRRCDYPLFWTPSKILLDRAGLSDDSLRRMPGTVGRVAVASISCPHCAEPNAVSAVDCVRCGRPLHPVHFVAPPPEPVYVPPPPMPEPEPEKRSLWWVWVLLGVVLAATITLVVLTATHTITWGH